jgi:hypothetical protein
MELKFRVWDKYIKKMITYENADTVQHEDVDTRIWELEQTYGRMGMMDRFPGWTYDQIDEGYHLSSLLAINTLMCGTSYSTEEVFVMRWTGEDDTQGTPIYEGDIVHSKYNNRMGVVAFGRFTLEPGDDGAETYPQLGFYVSEPGEYPVGMYDRYGNVWGEVVGNICENMDLITNQKPREDTV